LILEAGIVTSSCMADDALRIRASMSAMGSVIVIVFAPYQLAFVMPGISPLCAMWRKHRRQRPNFWYTARGRPHRLQRV
jgi:hypothetical protein